MIRTIRLLSVVACGVLGLACAGKRAGGIGEVKTLGSDEVRVHVQQGDVCIEAGQYVQRLAQAPPQNGVAWVFLPLRPRDGWGAAALPKSVESGLLLDVEDEERGLRRAAYLEYGWVELPGDVRLKPLRIFDLRGDGSPCSQSEARTLERIAEVAGNLGGVHPAECTFRYPESEGFVGTRDCSFLRHVPDLGPHQVSWHAPPGEYISVVATTGAVSFHEIEGPESETSCGGADELLRDAGVVLSVRKFVVNEATDLGVRIEASGCLGWTAVRTAVEPSPG